MIALDRCVIALPLPNGRQPRRLTLSIPPADAGASLSHRLSGERIIARDHVASSTSARTRTFRAPGRIDEPAHDFTRHHAPIFDLDPVYRALPCLLPSAESRLWFLKLSFAAGGSFFILSRGPDVSERDLFPKGSADARLVADKMMSDKILFSVAVRALTIRRFFGNTGRSPNAASQDNFDIWELLSELIKSPICKD